MRIALWLAQIAVGVPFVSIGYMKLTTPIAELGAMMAWAGEYPWLVRTMGVVDIAGGLGMLLPALTRILPQLMVPAALGCTMLQICAITVHVSRGEFGALPANFVFLACSAFVLWGRWKAAAIYTRW